MNILRCLGSMITLFDAMGNPVDPNKMKISGRFEVKHYRNQKLLDKFSFPNGITNVGKNHILETQFNGGTPVTAWYVGLINNASFSALAAADTMSSHAGWLELDTVSNTVYSEATRPEWTAGTAASQAITNAAAVVFTFTATAAVNGIFITSGTVKGGTTGTLWSTGSFSAVRNVINGDVLNVTYTTSIS